MHANIFLDLIGLIIFLVTLYIFICKIYIPGVKFVIKLRIGAIFLLILSKGSNENTINIKHPPILYINPCLPKPLTSLKISYLKNIMINEKENNIVLKRTSFNLFRTFKEAKQRPVTANGIVSLMYPTENLMLLLYLIKIL